MCGIVCMMSTDKLVGAMDRSKAFTQGVVVDTFRGHHSTGLVYTDWDGNTEIYKKPVPGYDFVNMPKYQEVMRDVENYPFLIAHNRYATKGAVNSANAHPFQHGDITGVHNGSLFSWNDLTPSDVRFDTDSEHIIYALAHNDSADVLKTLDGSFCLVWHDARDNTLHIARNDERPFALAHIANKGLVLGASEIEMLDLICARNDLTISDRYSVGSKTEFVFNLDDVTKPEMIAREMAEYWPAYNYNYGNTSGMHPRGGYPRTRKKQTTTPSTKQTNGSSTGLDSIYDNQVRGFGIQFIKYSPTGEWGYVVGSRIDTPYTEIRIHGWKEVDWDNTETKDGYFEGAILAEAVDQDGTKYLSVHKDRITWMTENEAYEGYDWNSESFSEVGDDDTDDTDQTTVLHLEHYRDNEEDTEPKKFYTRGNQLLTLKEAERLIQAGCVFCGNPIAIEDFNEIDWWHDAPICLCCDQTGEY